MMTSLAGCGTQVSEPMSDTIEVTDCAGRTVSVPADPQSISCVCPFSGAYIVMFGAGGKITSACNNMTRSLLLSSICPSVADAIVVKNSGSINAEEILEQNTDLLVVNGELYLGSRFMAGEFGHMVLDPEGPLCGCGQHGCLETFSSKTGMTNYIRDQIVLGRETMMEEFVRDGVFRAKKLRRAVEAGDAVAIEAVDRACHWLAVATGSAINMLSPDLILYGGGVIEAMGETFLKKILAEVDRYCMPQIRKTTEIKTAALGDDSILYGDLAMIKGL